MASLTAHLRQSDDHERLAFHAQCPLCAQRLAGTLPPETVVSRRTQALLAAGVLTLSTASPGAAFATEPDEEQEGVEQVVTAEPPSDSGFDPGGPATDLPFNAAPAPTEEMAPDPAGDSGPIELEPEVEEVAPMADAGDGVNALQQPPPEAVVPPPAPEASPEAPPPSPPAPAATAPAPTDAVTPPGADEREAEKQPAPKPRRTTPRPDGPKSAPHTDQKPQPEPVYSTNAPTTVPVATAPSAAATPRSTANSPAQTRSHPAQRGDRFHVVQRGESLWSIASDVLGEGASPARIAREVNQLWELNSARIGTGDRDLLMTGTRLEL